MFLKVAPDLEAGEVEAIVEACVAQGLAGIIVSNTTVSRPGPGLAVRGRGGRPFRRAADGAVDPGAGPSSRRPSAGRLALIGVGGIASGADAYAKIRAGACAVQLYSALVFEGPGLVGRIKRELAARLRADGFASVGAAVGAQ